GRPLAGLEQRVGLERQPALGRLGIRRDVVQPDQLDVAHRGVQDATQFGQLLAVTGGQEYPAHDVRAVRWYAASVVQPAAANSSRVSSSARLNTACSPVPCTSTKSPASVHTTFMSTSATTSSS